MNEISTQAPPDLSVKALTASVISRLGGIDGLAEMIAEDDRRVRSAEKKNERLILDRTRYFTGLLKHLDNGEVGSESFTDEELDQAIQANLMSLVIQRLEYDPHFLRKALIAVRDTDPAFFSKLMTDLKHEVIEIRE